MDSVSDLAIRAKIFAALGDPRRLEIADEVAASDRTPGELMEKLEMSSALLAHHLDVLEDAQVIQRFTSHFDRRKRFIRLHQIAAPYVEPTKIMRPVIFVCRHNSARSQLAAAIWQARMATSATSAGTDPASKIHPLTVKIASKHQLKLLATQPKKFDIRDARGKIVITVCDQSHDDLDEPLSRLHWSIPDPSVENSADAFESAFDELLNRIAHLEQKTDYSKEEK
ncbi:MAG: ArsC protein [Actinomycetota bacterium]